MAERRDTRLFAALAEELTARGMGIRFQAAGQSMRPAIEDGETIEVRPARESQMRRGDIVLTQSGAGMKAHRVVATGNDERGLVTRGDASAGEDAPSSGRPLGKVVRVERNGRSVELAGPGRAALQAANRALYRVRAAMRARAARWRSGAAAVLVLALGGMLGAPAAWAASDLSVTETVSPSVVAPGGTITYTITFTNTGTTNAATAALFMRTPANTTYNSVLPQGGWTCTNPGVGNAGAITCTRATFNANTTATFVIVVTVGAATPAGTQILQNVNGTSNTADTNGQNNSASATVLVEPAGDADMALSMAANPATVFVSATYTYNITVKDLGQANAANVTVTDTIPTSLTLVSATASQGTGCTTMAVMAGTQITCPLGTVNFQATATVAIKVTAPSSGAMISNTASVSTTSTDPVASNNSATVIVVVQPIVCAMSARDGTPGAAISGTVNTYYPPSGAQVVMAGQMTTSIMVGTASGAATPIAVGDLLLIIQMQDAAIDSNNAGDYGDGAAGDPGSGYTALNSAGLYEFVTATSAAGLTGPNTLTVTGTGANGGLLNTYTAAAATAGMGQRTFQVIRVPQYQAVTLGAVTAPAWNGTVGGILVLDVAGQLSLNATTLSMDALGFRGGAGIELNGTGTAGSANTDYRTLSTNPINSSKAEGIAGTPKYLANAAITNLITNAAEGYPNGSYGRGAPGNAGGGGTDGDPAANTENSGGGGGGNGGTGGVGGYGWNLPGVGQGFGGVAYPANISGIVMGGGGGAGTTNNGTADPTNANPAGINSSGAAGGGILLIRSGAVVGTGTLTANGQTALNVMQDGGGGGGAGGSIIFLALSGGLGTLTVNANGGTGGSTWRTEAPGGYPGQRHGPGGGGGGGVILLSTGTGVTTSMTGGADGLTDTDGDSFGSQPGTTGIMQTGIAPSQTPGVRSGAECALADLKVTDTGTPNPVTPTNNITYTQVITNSGPQDAVNASFTEQVPANTTFVSMSTVAGWTCVTPAVGGTGTITCTNPNFTNGSNANFSLVVKVNAGVASGTVVTDIASATSGINDPNFSNNTATVQTTVSAATAADESITVSATPNPVPAGGTITYTVMVMNNGPAATVQSVMTFPITGPSTFQSVTPPAGWVCTTPPVSTNVVVCRIASLAAGASGTFTIVTAVPAGTAGGTMIATTANIGCSTPDPSYANNNASTTVVVAAAGQADVGITGTVSPNPVLAGNNITYMLTVTNNGPSPTSAANVMVMDTLPAGVTFVSATPTTGSCGFAAGAITCSLGTLAAGASVNIVVVDMVNAATTAGTMITSTFMESSTTSDPNAANGSVMLSTIVAVPNDADVSVTKSGSPNPVNLNSTLVYTIQVRNNGPAVATNVMLSDTLPAAVTYVSSSSTQGTCTQAGGTVTCNNIGTMSVGQLVVVTINVTATTFSSGALATNTVTITHADPDANPANNTATFTSTIQATTAVQLASFQAKPVAGGGVLVEWQTREESHNLGFHLYRLQNGTKTRLDTSLIAGAALMFRGGLPQHGAKTYRWLDASGGPGGAEYELESVDVNGTRSTHGPAMLEEGAAPVAAPAAAAANSRTLEQMNRAMVEADRGNARMMQALPAMAQGAQSAAVSSATLALRPAVKISIQHEGWYRVTQAQLLAAGMPRGTDVRSLHLYAEGVEQSFQVDGAAAGPLGPNGGIEFYGTGIDTPFSDTRVYWLESRESSGERIGSANSSRGGNTPAASFPFAAVREDHTTYFAALLNGENNDNFFGALVSTTPVEQDLTATHNDAQFAGAALAVTLQGATDGQAHRVSVTFNGIYLGEIDFYGFGSQSQTFPLAAGQVTEGTNAVELTSLAGDNDYSLVQSITLVYGHTYAADGNWLRMTARGGDGLQVTGFTNPQIAVYDITNPLQINQVGARVSMGGGSYSVTFTAPGAAGRTATLLAFSADQIEPPAGVENHAPTDWGRAQNSADVVIITHADFADSLTPLVNLRRRQGHRVALVPVDDLYDEFNYGERSPYALQSFLAAAEAEWRPKPQSVLLVGDASFDPRNYLGLGDFDFVPTRIIETAALKTASDDWFSDFKGSGFATIPTGRLPVRTSADAALVTGKIVGYETGASPGPWTSQVLLVGDQNRDYDFTSATNAVEQLLPPTVGVTKILADGQDPGTVHQQLIDAINSGQVMVNFLGHGSVEQWSLSGYFADADAASLTNGGNLPFVVSMDCLSGFFHDVYTTSLAESLLLAPQGGAVAVWASSGFTTADPQATMDRALIGELAANPTETLGAAILKTKAGTTDQDVRRTWILFGDPAMRLRLPAPTGASAKR